MVFLSPIIIFKFASIFFLKELSLKTLISTLFSVVELSSDTAQSVAKSHLKKKIILSNMFRKIIVKNTVFLYGYMNFCTDIWISVRIYGILYGFMEFCTDIWISVRIYGFLYGYIDFCTDL